jgi:transposase
VLGLNGYIDYDLYHGSYNIERFLSFIKQLLVTKMNTYSPRVPLSVLIIDNALINSGPELATLCERYGVRLEFLPPYCLYLNSIKETFYKLKRWIKGYRKLIAKYAILG